MTSGRLLVIGRPASAEAVQGPAIPRRAWATANSHAIAASPETASLFHIHQVPDGAALQGVPL